VKLDLTKMTATLQQALHQPGQAAGKQPGQHAASARRPGLVGWGAEPYYTEFDSDGSVIMNGQLPNDDQSYRAFTGDWAGYPADKPAVALRPTRHGHRRVHELERATEVATWRVLAGKHPSSLAAVATQPRNGFETVIVANSTGPCFAVPRTTRQASSSASRRSRSSTDAAEHPVRAGARTGRPMRGGEPGH